MSLNFLTPQDMELAMKKQLEDMRSEIEKSQGKLIENMKKMMRVELRRNAAPTTFSATPSNASKMDRSARRLHTKRLSVALPFKSMNAKLNDADELDTQERREELSHAHLGQEQASDVSPRSPQEENAVADAVANRHGSARGLQMEEAQENQDAAKQVAVEPIQSEGTTQDPTADRSSVQTGQPTEPLLQSENGIEQHNQTTAKKDWIAILQNPMLEGSIVCVVVLNSLWIGAELEYRVSVSRVRPTYFDWIDALFCLLFSAELVFRISVLGRDFFKHSGSQCIWNYFDFTLVLSQIMELALRLLEFEIIDKKNVNVSWLRILRILRIVRLTRIVRTVRFLEGLRTLMKCLVRGMAATGWITLFLLMQIYTCSLAFTELLHWTRGSFKTGQADGAELDMMFGSLVSTMGTLCKSITGGILWDSALEPLMEVSKPLGLAFMVYVSFSLLVILNIFTGFFVNTSSMCADEDNKTMLRDRVADIFVVDENDHYLSNVSEKIFTERVSSPEMQSYLNQIDLHIDEAEGLFKLLDLNGQGTLDPIQIVSGLMRMRGAAKALDLRVLMYLVTRGQEINTEQMNSMDEKITRIYGSIASLQDQKEDQKEAGQKEPSTPLKQQITGS